MNTSTEWVDSPEHPGYRVKTIKHGNCTIQVLRPILDDKERRRREAQAVAVTSRVLRDIYIRKEENLCRTT